MKNYLITAGIALGVVLLVLIFMPAKVINQVQTLGAVSSPDIMSPYFSFGGVRQWAAHTDNLNHASTTICSMQSPAATSTLVFGSVKLTTGTTTAIALEMAKDTSYAATTTRISYDVLASGAQTTMVAFVASTTGAYGANGQAHTADELDMVFAPNTYLNVKYGGAAGALNVLVGSCNAVWVQN